MISALEQIIRQVKFYNNAYVNDLLRPPSGVLLYGPPGCGKTMLVQNVLESSGLRMLRVSTATIVSKYHGDTEKNIQNLFSIARKLEPCIIFLDEVDDLFSKRTNHHHDAISRGSKTQFMQEMVSEFCELLTTQ